MVGSLLIAACDPGPDPFRFPIGEISVGEASLSVWVADEAPERRQGLRGVARLPDEIDGMLFVFPMPASLSFTMRDTLIPLDIWWFDGDMRLIGRTAMEPCQGEPCVSYGSPGDARWALETMAGEWTFMTGSELSIVENG